MQAPPHAMVPGSTEQDYYANRVTSTGIREQEATS